MTRLLLRRPCVRKVSGWLVGSVCFLLLCQGLAAAEGSAVSSADAPETASTLEAGTTGVSGQTASTVAAEEPVNILTMTADAQEIEQQERFVRDIMPSFLQSVGQYEVLGIDAWRVLSAALVILLTLCIGVCVRWFLGRLEKRKATEEGEEGKEASHNFWRCLIFSVRLPIQIAIWAGAVCALFPILMLSSRAGMHMAEVVLSIAVAVFAYRIVDLVEYYLMRYAEATENKLDDMLVPMARKTLRILAVIVAGLHIYQTVGGNISTLLAGLGIGGLAVALAAQDTIKNLFGFVMIVLDRPFLVGERVVIHGFDGTIEQVGFRSTRIRTLDGHMVTVPNAQIADSAVHNIGKRPFIKRAMNITITYDTPLDKVEKAVEIVREILDNHEGMDPEFLPRVFFNDLNADSLNILAIYWYHPPAYWDFLEHAQRVNLELMRRYEAEGIEFAFPTQTLYLAGDPKRELILKNLNASIPGQTE